MYVRRNGTVPGRLWLGGGYTHHTAYFPACERAGTRRLPRYTHGFLHYGPVSALDTVSRKGQRQEDTEQPKERRRLCVRIVRAMFHRRLVRARSASGDSPSRGGRPVVSSAEGTLVRRSAVLYVRTVGAMFDGLWPWRGDAGSIDRQRRRRVSVSSHPSVPVGTLLSRKRG